ncbi:MAG: hypothetical protein ACRDQU_05665 [Pseudonocardiaceae bacterium]
MSTATKRAREALGARLREIRQDAAGFTNLLVIKENGIIVLNPYAANCCVIRLDEQAATALHGIITEWL